MFASIIPLALLVAPAVSGAASWWTIRQGESFLRLVECYQSDSDSTDEPHVYCTLNLETPRLGPLDTCHVKWFFDPAVTGEVTTEAGHFLGSRAWGECCCWVPFRLRSLPSETLGNGAKEM